MSRRRPPTPVTGTQLLSWAGFWLLLAYSIASMLLANVDLANSNLALRLAISAGATIVLFGLLAAWERLARRWPAVNARSWRVIAAFVVLALVRAVFVAVALNELGLTQSIDWPRRIIGSVAGFTTVMVLIDLVLGSMREHRRRVSLLLARQKAARQARDEAVESIETQREEAVERITGELMRRVEELAGDNPRHALAGLRSTAEDLVRPLSHELAKASPAIVAPPPVVVRPRFDIRAFISDATSGAPLSPAWVAVLFMLFGGPFLISVLPWGQALVHLAIGFVAIWLALTLVNAVIVRIPPRVPQAARVATLLVLITAASFLLALSSVATIHAPADVLSRIVIGDVTLLIELSLALVIARAARLQDETIEQQLEQAAFDLDWETARARCIQWRQQRWLARAMHGPVQGAIASSAARLERAIEADDAEPQLMDNIRSQLVEVFSSLKQGMEDSSHLSALVEEFAQTWTGVCTITLDADALAISALDTDQVARFAVREAVSEACWNALKHAHPSRIAIEVLILEERVLRVEVTDNGSSPPTDAERQSDGEAGLGTRMMQDMTLSWARTMSETGTTFTCEIPVDTLRQDASPHPEGSQAPHIV